MSEQDQPAKQPMGFYAYETVGFPGQTLVFKNHQTVAGDDLKAGDRVAIEMPCSYGGDLIPGVVNHARTHIEFFSRVDPQQRIGIATLQMREYRVWHVSRVEFGDITSIEQPHA